LALFAAQEADEAVLVVPQTTPDFSSPTNLAATLKQLPPMAQILSRLQRLLADVNSGLDDVAALIRLDSALATRVIQGSNSAYFGRGAGCRTLEEAVNRIGFSEVYRIVSVIASGSIVAHALPAYGRDSLAMWKESISCAFGSELVAEKIGEDTAIAYMNGLLHAIGRLAINGCIGAITGDPQRVLTDDGFPNDHSGAEIALLGFSQAEVSAAMLTKWGFSPENSMPVRHQYDPLAAEVPHDQMAAVLYTGRFLRTAICQGHPPLEVPGADDVFQSIRLTYEEVLECVEPLQDRVDRALHLTKL
jgi:HD-like signal output (HDOD) protein